MILRRITQHIKDQNWFAVALDFVIVVFGVFIGIQVANWNGERENRELERGYLGRLHAEIEFTISSNREAVKAELERLTHLREVGAYFKKNDASDLTSRHCHALFRSHIFFKNVAAVTSLNELKSTGRILLISDHDLRTALVRYDQFNVNAAKRLENLRIDRMVLSRHHPELMKLDPTDLFGETAVCDFPAMKQNQSFINHFAENTARYWAYSESILNAELETLEDIHVELDRVLKLDHEGGK